MSEPRPSASSSDDPYIADRRRAAVTRHERGTRHERARRHEPGAPGAAVALLPPALQDALTDVRGLPRSGGQSEAVRGIRVDQGDDVFVKLYYEHSLPDADLLDRLHGADGRLVATVLGHGPFEDRYNGTPRWWEMQSFYPLGSLANLLAAPGASSGDEPAQAVLVEARTALDYCHTVLDHAHRDISPGNFLVRRVNPLQLVLSDFGSARRQTLSRRFSSARFTEHYAAPESLNGHLGKEQDWWSLGMVLLEILLGRHPYEDLEKRTVMDRLTNYDVDLEDIPDRRWQLLLQGLLTRSREHRWGSSEVGRWLTGESPAVVTASQQHRHPPLDVDGRPVATPRKLAALFADEPELAQDWMRREHNRLADWLAEDVRDTTWSVLPLRRPITSEVELRVQMVSFAAHFAPDITPPRFRGHHVDVDGLCALLEQAAAGRTPATEVVREIVDRRLVGLFARTHCPDAHDPDCGTGGCARLRAVARSLAHDLLVSARTQLQPYVTSMQSPELRTAFAPGRLDVESLARAAEATALRYLLNPDGVGRCRQDLNRKRGTVSWWDTLRAAALRESGPLNGLLDLALAEVTLVHAQEERAFRDELARRTAAAETEAAARAQRHERERVATERRAARRTKAVRANQTLTRWSIPVLAGGVLKGALEGVRRYAPDVHAELYAEFFADPTFFLVRFWNFWFGEFNTWMFEPPVGDLVGPLVNLSEPWAQPTLLAIGAAALLCLLLIRPLRRSHSPAFRAFFVTVVAINAALVYVFAPEVAAVVGLAAFAVAGVALVIAIVAFILMVMVAGS